jgi:hypothetical protein
MADHPEVWDELLAEAERLLDHGLASQAVALACAVHAEAARRRSEIFFGGSGRGACTKAMMDARAVLKRASARRRTKTPSVELSGS